MAGERTVKKRFRLSLDISRPVSNREFTLVEGDTGNELLITLVDDGEPVDLTDCRVLALFSKSDGTTVSQDSGADDNGVSIGGEMRNEVKIELFVSSFAPGMVECELQIYSGATLSTLVTSAKFNFRCRRGILNRDTIAAVPEYPLLTSLLSEVTGIAAELAAANEAVEAVLGAADLLELIELASLSGILKGDGAGGLSAAVANGDYYEPPMRAADLAIPPSAWQADETYEYFPFRAAIALDGASASMTPDVVFAPGEATSDSLAPVAAAYDGGVYVYAAAAPADAIGVAALTLWKGVK